ncbi:cell death regulator Aven [Centroberyx gerrardi]|uniref:cell death regulator Aven n=1 Tax=Centroberyx gerrardi TaxID=166262 RepID=UPI003AB07CA8
MEGRPSRGRGGSWRRGGGRGNDSESCGGEHRGRGRGGHHRGRGKRDHYRGRGRGGGAPAAGFHHRGQDEGDDLQLEDDGMEVFSRRKLESNWDRYQESERAEPADDTPTQRGTDYHVLLESAGDSFTQFRFAEEKDWEMDSSAANQMSAVSVDLSALAQCLQEVPLHQRLNLEAELVQVSTPVELPTMTVAPKQDTAKTAVFPPPPSGPKGLRTGLGISSQAADPAPGPDPQASSGSAEPPVDDIDEELDQLLTLQKPASDVSGEQSVSVAEEESAAPDELPGEAKEVVPEMMEEKMEEVKEVAPPKAAPIRQEVTEEDLEDWLDSMIS